MKNNWADHSAYVADCDACARALWTQADSAEGKHKALLKAQALHAEKAGSPVMLEIFGRTFEPTETLIREGKRINPHSAALARGRVISALKPKTEKKAAENPLTIVSVRDGRCFASHPKTGKRVLLKNKTGATLADGEHKLRVDWRWNEIGEQAL